MSTGGFPMNVVDEIVDRLPTLMPDHTVVGRALKMIDPAQSVGVYPVNWDAIESSQQIGQEEPALQRYLYRVQNMVRSGEEDFGRQMFSFDSKTIRVVLYRDPVLRVRLPLLTEELLDSRETVKRWGVGRQQFLNTELQSEFTFVAQTDFWVETESVEL